VPPLLCECSIDRDSRGQPRPRASHYAPRVCGIAGILRLHAPGSAPPAPALAIPDSSLAALDARIAHRGPDGSGIYRDRATRPDGVVIDCALVHRRLAIIDPADGHQPMIAASASAPALAVVFNGCIYNHAQLRRELTSLGHTFTTHHSDTEVLLHGYRAWGTSLFERLEGMFALALWSHAEGDLILARDRIGEKPLYFADSATASGAATPTSSHTLPQPRTIAFASTPAALRDLMPAALFHPDASRVAAWLRFGWHDQPPMRGIRTLSPDTHAVLPDGMPRRTPRTQPTRDRSPTITDVDAVLSRAVRDRLIADVPVGCFLSGGVDSSLIASCAKDADPTIAAFTVRMPDASLDESAHAAAVAAHLKVRHVVLDCNAAPADDLVALIAQLGLPFADSSLLPTYWVSKAAATAAKVALSGDGGDELFCGYERYRAAWLFHRLRPARPLFRFAARLHRPNAVPASNATRRDRFLRAAGGEGFTDLLAIFPNDLLRQLGAPIAPPALAHAPARSGDPIADAMERDLVGYLPDDILRKTDTASMAVPIEVRAPFLDSRVVDLARSATVAALTPAGQRKGLLRALARSRLPASVVDRPKQGFAIPIGSWFRTNFGGLRTLLLDTLSAADAFPSEAIGFEVKRPVVRRLLDEHLAPIPNREHGQRLYALLVLSLWAKANHGSTPTTTPHLLAES
jgi:asparagine synthase (glutamine-hydrolysing)